jgi:hypothetical protein
MFQEMTLFLKRSFIMQDRLDRALYRHPGYPPGCRLRDVDDAGGGERLAREEEEAADEPREDAGDVD